MKVHISADTERIAVVAHDDQLFDVFTRIAPYAKAEGPL